MQAVQFKLVRISSWLELRAIRIQDPNLAAHLRMDVAEVVEDATVRRIRHGLRHRQLSRIFLAHPLCPREKELRLVAVQACVASIRACGIRAIDLVPKFAFVTDSSKPPESYNCQPQTFRSRLYQTRIAVTKDSS